MKISKKFSINPAYLFVLPYVIFFVLFVAWPLFFCIKLAFFKWNLGASEKFAGTHFIIKIFNDEIFWKALLNTLEFVAINLPLQIALALILAIALNQKIKGKLFFRASYFFPVIISGAVTSILWLWLLNKDIGIVNQLLVKLLHIKPVAWLSSEALALPSIALHATWKNVGLTIVILLAGLQSIPRSIYEAADLDGVNSWQKFWKITLPVLNPTLVMVVILTTMGAFSLFVEPLVMTNNGGPGISSLSLYLYIFQKFSFGNLSYSATIGLATALFILAIVLIQKKFIEKEPYF